MTKEFHVIKDSVYGSIQFPSKENRWIKPFIDSENFQRLRHIKQLGMADWIFPGAVHTRFSHCLGCCYIANEIADKLELSDENKQIVMIAGLLHDIGHGPFSHAFEDIFYQNCVKHELWTPMFLEEYCSDEFIHSYNQLNPDSKLNPEKMRVVQDLIMHRYHKNQLIADMVSSQLDADRLDYLLRDSHFCGVTYGTYDFRWLVHCLTDIKFNKKMRLGITRKGVGAVEQYLMARRLMMRNVYQNGKKFAAEYLMQEFLKAIAKAIHEKKEFILREKNALIEFLEQVNLFNQQAKKSTSLEKIRDRFIEEHYHLFKQLCDYDVFVLARSLSNNDENHSAIMLAKRLQERTLPKVIYIDEKKSNQAKKIIKEFKKENGAALQSWQIGLTNIPHLSYEMSNDPILVRENTGKINFLHDDSMMINAMSDKRENLCLVFIDIAMMHQSKIKQLYSILQSL